MLYIQRDTCGRLILIFCVLANSAISAHKIQKHILVNYRNSVRLHSLNPEESIKQDNGMYISRSGATPRTNEKVSSSLVNSHAESPVYDPELNTLYWVDVLNQDIHALDYVTFEHRVKHLAYGEVNIVVPIVNSTRLLVGCRSQLFILDWEQPGDSALRLVVNLEPLKPDNVLNEGKVDALGRFWGGTKGRQQGDKVAMDDAALYSVEHPCFTPVVQLKPVTISNGLAWSLNNTILYYIDSATNKIEAFDFNLRRGHLSRRRTILDLDEWGYPHSCPDGMTRDRDGMIWIALHANGSIIRVDPDQRRVIETYQLPVGRTTSVTWAGEKLEDLVVTTSRRNLKPLNVDYSPLSGTIFILRNLGTGGVPDNKFIFDHVHSYK